LVTDEERAYAERLRNYIDQISSSLYKISKEIRDLQAEVTDIRNSTSRERAHSLSPAELYYSQVERAKIDVLGKFCITLMDKGYFPTNDSLKSFANSLGVPIPGRPSGRLSRNELIGIIITKVAAMPEEEISKIREALEQALKRAKAKSVPNFVREWEDVIRNGKTSR